MQTKRILLTGDDGYNSIGIRLLIAALKDKHELSIAATKHQQSGVGGKLSLSTGGAWDETEVDGISGIWVEGSPADAVECANVYFEKPFDLILSGINLGLNIGSTIVSSGTYGGLMRGMGLQLAPKGIALSWNVPSKLMLKTHDAGEDLKSYHLYFEKLLVPLFDKIFAAGLWGVDILNINFPTKPTRKIRFTKMNKNISQVFGPTSLDFETKRFSYESSHLNIQENNPRYDVGALKKGYISITPCAYDVTHFTTFQKLEKTELEL
ncbi:MAG TPA: 5'/3'-nucleotidase SurE [Patescibacteria group bacterium]